MRSVAGGSTCAAAPHAGTSAAATTRLRSTRRRIGATPGTPSSGPSNRARTGSGTSRRTSITTDPYSPGLTAIPPTSRYQGRVTGCPRTGSSNSVAAAPEPHVERRRREHTDRARRVRRQFRDRGRQDCRRRGVGLGVDAGRGRALLGRHTGNEVFLLLAKRRSARSADDRHPLGYGREAYVWSLLAAIGLF